MISFADTTEEVVTTDEQNNQYFVAALSSFWCNFMQNICQMYLPGIRLD